MRAVRTRGVCHANGQLPYAGVARIRFKGLGGPPSSCEHPQLVRRANPTWESMAPRGRVGADYTLPDLYRYTFESEGEPWQ